MNQQSLSSRRALARASLLVVTCSILPGASAADCNPVVIGSHNTPGIPVCIRVANDVAFVMDQSTGLLTFDVSNPAEPALLGSSDLRGRGFALKGKLAYIAAGKLLIVDVSNPAAPTLLGTYKDPLHSAEAVTIVGDIAYLACGISGLVMVNVSDPVAPAFLGSCGTPDIASDVRLEGDFAYVADSYAGLQVIDVSDPALPVLVGSCDTAHAYAVEVADHMAYVADLASGLQIIDVSNPVAPSILGSYDSGFMGKATAICVAESVAYVSDDHDGLKIIDVSNATSPSLLGSYQIAGGVYGVDVAGGLGYLSCGLFSPGPCALHIIDVSACQTCPADLDGNGTLELFDFLAFLNFFNAADPAADCDNSGSLNLFDFLCFTNAFNAGC